MAKKYAWRTGRSCFFKIFYHLVFVTKYRRGVFTKKMLIRIKALFEETCLQMEAELLEFNGEHDHIHIMISCPPKVPIAVLIGKLENLLIFYVKNFGQNLRKNYGECIFGVLVIVLLLVVEHHCL